MPLPKGAIAFLLVAAPVLFLAAFLSSCSRDSAQVSHSNRTAPGFEARGVALEIALSTGGQLVVRGDLFSLDETDGTMSVSGGASVTAKGDASRLTARAERIVVKPDGPTLDLEGGVSAVFRAPESEDGDAAP